MKHQYRAVKTIRDLRDCVSRVQDKHLDLPFTVAWAENDSAPMVRPFELVVRLGESSDALPGDKVVFGWPGDPEEMQMSYLVVTTSVAHLTEVPTYDADQS